MTEEILIKISYLEVGLSALKYYVLNQDRDECLRIVDDIAQSLLDIGEDLEDDGFTS